MKQTNIAMPAEQNCYAKMSSAAPPFSLLQAAQFAYLAYELPDVVQNAYRNKTGDEDTLSCLRNVIEEPVYLTDPETDVQAYAMLLLDGDKHTLLVTVRGTSSVIDAFKDIEAINVPLPVASTLAPGVRVHCGFLSQYVALAPLLRPVVTKLLEKGDAFNIVFTGHSAGAGIGALAALHAALDHEEGVQYIGFGSPRVGNLAFCDLFRKYIATPVLVKYSRDPVTKVAQGLGYTHICDFQCYGSFDQFPCLPVLFDMPDHHILNYVEAVRQDDKMRQATWFDKSVQMMVGWLTDRLR
jgi:hypothetical protein